MQCYVELKLNMKEIRDRLMKKLMMKVLNRVLPPERKKYHFQAKRLLPIGIELHDRRESMQIEHVSVHIYDIIMHDYKKYN